MDCLYIALPSSSRSCTGGWPPRCGPPLILYAFSRTRTRDTPLNFLEDSRGHLQADAPPGYDPPYLSGMITEVARTVHARRRFVEAADPLKTPGRPHETLAFYKELFRIGRQIKGLTDAERRMRAVAVGRKAFLFVGSERAGHAAVIYHSLVESYKANKINPLPYLTCILSNARNSTAMSPTPQDFAKSTATRAGKCHESTLLDALRAFDAATRV